MGLADIKVLGSIPKIKIEKKTFSIFQLLESENAMIKPNYHDERYHNNYWYTLNGRFSPKLK